jgi:hypothetical protein
MIYRTSTSIAVQGRSRRRRGIGRRASLLCWVASAALAMLALLPALAQAGKGTTEEQLTVSVFSEESNSLCTKPIDGSIFSNPGTESSPNFAPLEVGNSQSAPFPDTGSACTEPLITFPKTEGGVKGGESGFKYDENGHNRPLYESRIPGAEWVTAYAGAESGAAPAYYIYDAEFNMQCVKGAVLNGEFAADNAAGVFLNGHWIGQDAMAETSANFTPTAFSDIEKYFVSGKNILQFVVLDTSPPYTGLDFAATTKYGPCASTKWVNVGSEKEQTQSSGTVTFNSAVGPVKCKKADAGNIWNPATGGNGLDETVLFDLYECSAGECPKGVTVKANGLPWNSELVDEGGVIRDKSTDVGFTIECEGRDFSYNGTISPKFVNATKKAWGYDEFGEGSGSLESTTQGVAPLTITGKDNMAGFLNMEPITASATTTKRSSTEKAEEKVLAKETKTIEKFWAANRERIEEQEENKEEEEIAKREEK